MLQRRRDTGQWALPGGAQDIGETATECVVRECLVETGIVAEITGFLGVYTNPRHIVAATARSASSTRTPTSATPSARADD
ncbi:NUDIX domain-containing protein [Streptomyces solincola]|uniref:NUDIX domain-containing protein n=1 Tax=Streptomyces solincola TaxID=2100817 RepID=UPI00389B2CA9